MDYEGTKNILAPLSDIKMSKEQERIVLTGLRERMAQDVPQQKQHRRGRNYLWVTASSVAVFLVCGAIYDVFFPRVSVETTKTPVVAHNTIPVAFRHKLTSIHMATKEVGFATSPDGLFRTLNGGKTWTNVTPPLILNQISQMPHLWENVQPPMYVLNSKMAWVAISVTSTATNGSMVDVPHILYTDDGGTTWHGSMAQTLSSGTGERPQFLKFDSQTHGWLVTQVFNNGGEAQPDRTLFETTDGGKSWKIVAHASTRGTTYASIGLFPSMSPRAGSQWVKFFGNGTGLTQGQLPGKELDSLNLASTSLYRTTDGGAHWQRLSVSLPFKTTPFRVTFMEPGVFGNEVLVPVEINYNSQSVNDQLLMLKSMDGGKTFQEITHLDVPPFGYSITEQDGFINNHFGWITAGNALFMFDGKGLLPPMGIPPQDDWANVDFVDTQYGFLVSSGKLLASVDGGQSFQQIDNQRETE